MPRPFHVFPNRLRHYRMLAGLKQSELADRAGLAAPDLSMIEAGFSLPTRDLLARFAELLSTPSWILYDEAFYDDVYQGGRPAAD